MFALVHTLMMSLQCCADPALPPIEQDGESISITLEPAQRHQRPERNIDRAVHHYSRVDTGARQDALPKLPPSLRGRSW